MSFTIKIDDWHEFHGWSDPDGSPGGSVLKVCFNEYDEDRTKAAITASGGAETLHAYVEDDKVPGLYWPAPSASPSN